MPAKSFGQLFLLNGFVNSKIEEHYAIKNLLWRSAHHFNTQQLIKEKTTNLVADQKYKKWLCPEMHDSESTRRKLLMVHSSIYC